MSESEGIARAFEVLGDKIKNDEAALRHVMNQRDELREKCKELTEQLKRAEADRNDACRYALSLEQLLEGYKEKYKNLTKGGADKCKKS